MVIFHSFLYVYQRVFPCVLINKPKEESSHWDGLVTVKPLTSQRSRYGSGCHHGKSAEPTAHDADAMPYEKVNLKGGYTKNMWDLA
jgi:hypothetical protein